MKDPFWYDLDHCNLWTIDVYSVYSTTLFSTTTMTKMTTMTTMKTMTPGLAYDESPSALLCPFSADKLMWHSGPKQVTITKNGDDGDGRLEKKSHATLCFITWNWICACWSCSFTLSLSRRMNADLSLGKLEPSHEDLSFTFSEAAPPNRIVGSCEGQTVAE